jgi:hypothetical protein
MYMALSDTTIRQARASGTDYTLKDADGLALFVTAQGAKSWHFRFCWGGKQPRISLRSRHADPPPGGGAADLASRSLRGESREASRSASRSRPQIHLTSFLRSDSNSRRRAAVGLG